MSEVAVELRLVTYRFERQNAPRPETVAVDAPSNGNGTSPRRISPVSPEERNAIALMVTLLYGVGARPALPSPASLGMSAM